MDAQNGSIAEETNPHPRPAITCQMQVPCYAPHTVGLDPPTCLLRDRSIEASGLRACRRSCVRGLIDYSDAPEQRRANTNTH